MYNKLSTEAQPK